MSAVPARASARSAKPTSEFEMNIAIQCRAHMGAIVQAVAPHLPLKSALPRAAIFIGINARRARALWNREARSVLAEEIQALEAARARIAERVITKEISEHANRLEVHASRLLSICPDTYRAEADRLRLLARRARSVFDQDGEA